MLADRRRAGIRTIPSLLQIFKLMLHYVMSESDVTDLLITINPSHEVFYTRYLPFESLAGLRHYPAVKNAPALAKRANLPGLTETAKNHHLYDFFMETSTPERIFAHKKVLTEDELRELFVVKRRILPRLPGFAVDYLKQCYPDYDFDHVLAPVENEP